MNLKDDGIEASWRFASHALRNGAGVAIHLSELDPRGHERASGVVASGPVSFGRIYSALNETLLRGGKYKNGAAIVLHLDADHPDILEFIETPRSELPWVKRCVNITDELWDKFEHKDALLLGIKRGDIWLNKIRHDGENRFMETSALKFTCHHAELACCNISISVPVSSTKSQKLLLTVCPNCAASMASQVLESLVNTCHPKWIDKSDLEYLDLPTSFEGTE